MNFLTQMSKYVLYVSLVLNGVLLMFLAGPVPFFLYLSIVVNLFLAWYSATCVMEVNNLENDMIELMKANEKFLNELEDIHSLEMYYGDENLQNLIDQSRQLVNNFIDVQERYFDVEVIELDDDDENEAYAEAAQEE